MAAFELQDNTLTTPEPATLPLEVGSDCDRRRVKDECIIAYKVYDSCRRQNCLTHRELGAARIVAGEAAIQDGGIVEVDPCAASVTMDKLNIKSIQVVDKQPSPFRAGHWDVGIRYVFEYRLTFREACGKIIEKKDAHSIFDMKSTLFGSTGNDLVVGTDLFKGSGGATFTAAPFIWVEAKAVGLDAKLHHSRRGHTEVHVTIGLFGILKLFRLVHLNVQSKGFCIPCRNLHHVAYLNSPINVYMFVGQCNFFY